MHLAEFNVIFSLQQCVAIACCSVVLTAKQRKNITNITITCLLVALVLDKVMF